MSLLQPFRVNSSLLQGEESDRRPRRTGRYCWKKCPSWTFSLPMSLPETLEQIKSRSRANARCWSVSPLQHSAPFAGWKGPLAGAAGWAGGFMGVNKQKVRELEWQSTAGSRVRAPWGVPAQHQPELYELCVLRIQQRFISLRHMHGEEEKRDESKEPKIRQFQEGRKSSDGGGNAMTGSCKTSQKPACEKEEENEPKCASELSADAASISRVAWIPLFGAVGDIRAFGDHGDSWQFNWWETFARGGEMMPLKNHAEPQPPNSASLISCGCFIESVGASAIQYYSFYQVNLNFVFSSNIGTALNLGTFGDLWLQKE